MGISQSALARLYLLALLLGAFLGVVYDLLRMTRIFLGAHCHRGVARKLSALSLPWLPKSAAKGERKMLGTVTFFEDFFFAVFAGVSLILLLYEANNGKFRVLAVLCVLLGGFLYRMTLGRAVLPLLEGMAFFLGTFVRYLLFVLLQPFRFAWRVTVRVTKGLLLRFLYAERKRRRRQFTKREFKYLHARMGGLLPREELKIKEREGQRRGAEKQEAIQSQPRDACISGGHDRPVNRNLRYQRDALQRVARGAKKA